MLFAQAYVLVPQNYCRILDCTSYELIAILEPPNRPLLQGLLLCTFLSWTAAEHKGGPDSCQATNSHICLCQDLFIIV